MGFSRVVYAYCDGKYENCELRGDEAFGADGGFRTIVEAKEALMLAGWRVGNKKILCPACSQALSAKED
ncbi:MAG: hypothetical protein V3U75_04170 [Methylococcaceae bacterium]